MNLIINIEDFFYALKDTEKSISLVLVQKSPCLTQTINSIKPDSIAILSDRIHVGDWTTPYDLSFEKPKNLAVTSKDGSTEYTFYLKNLEVTFIFS